MSLQVKNYKISLWYIRAHQKHRMNKEVRAVSEAEAIKKIYSLIGASNVKQRHIHITGVKVINDLNQIKSPLFRELSQLE